MNAKGREPSKHFTHIQGVYAHTGSEYTKDIEYTPNHYTRNKRPLEEEEEEEEPYFILIVWGSSDNLHITDTVNTIIENTKGILVNIKINVLNVGRRKAPRRSQSKP